MRYTARDDDKLREAAWQETFGKDAPPGQDPAPALMGQALPQVRMFSVRHDFPDAWHRWLHPAPDQTWLALELDLSRRHFPYYPPNRQIVLKSLRFVFVTAPATSAEGLTARLKFMPAGTDIGIAADPAAAAFAEDGQIASLAVCDFTPSDGRGLGRWQLVITASDNITTNTDVLEVNAADDMARVVKEHIFDLQLLCSYDFEDA
jgi:hypothetical protein